MLFTKRCYDPSSVMINDLFPSKAATIGEFLLYVQEQMHDQYSDTCPEHRQ